jgi:hypothetical protein
VPQSFTYAVLMHRAAAELDDLGRRPHRWTTLPATYFRVPVRPGRNRIRLRGRPGTLDIETREGAIYLSQSGWQARMKRHQSVFRSVALEVGKTEIALLHDARSLAARPVAFRCNFTLSGAKLTFPERRGISPLHRIVKSAVGDSTLTLKRTRWRENTSIAVIIEAK